MHIPDGFLSLPTTIVTNGLTLGTLIPALRKVNRTMSPKRIPLLGLTAAFVFTVQLISFPVFGGTSVHIIGAVLISVLLGPFTGLIIITASLIMQALLFQHGGFTTLGANILNMGVTGCLLGYGLYRIIPGNNPFVPGLAAWITTTLCGFLTAVELGLSGTIPFKVGIATMTSASAITGVIETIATVSIFSFIAKVRPDLLLLEKA